MISRVKIKDAEYTLKDPVARGEEEETEGISRIEIDGVEYECKDIVARGEGEATATEISKISVRGKVYQVKDEIARIPVYDNYFAVYSADDDSLIFYGDDTVPDAGTQYGGKTVTTVYTGFLSTGTSNPPWYSNRTTFKYARFDSSFARAKPTSCYNWFYRFENCTAIDGLKYLNTSNVTRMDDMFDCCYNLTTLDVSNFDTSNVTRMDEMFRECYDLTTLDVSNFDTSKVTDMDMMFYQCYDLTTIYSDDSKFVATSGDEMFMECESLEGGNGTRYDDVGIDDSSMAHVDTPDNPGYFTAKD